jgi:hypothetical protein
LPKFLGGFVATGHERKEWLSDPTVPHFWQSWHFWQFWQ